MLPYRATVRNKYKISICSHTGIPGARGVLEFMCMPVYVNLYTIEGSLAKQNAPEIQSANPSSLPTYQRY